MIIALGADHRGYAHKEIIKQAVHFHDAGITFLDFGTKSAERTDYPLFVKPICQALQKGSAQLGILLCGSGIGMCIAANRFDRIYAGVVWNSSVARAAKEDDNINILVIPSDFVSDTDILNCVASWLHARFKAGRYQDRIAMIDKLGCGLKA